MSLFVSRVHSELAGLLGEAAITDTLRRLKGNGWGYAILHFIGVVWPVLICVCAYRSMLASLCMNPSEINKSVYEEKEGDPSYRDLHYFLKSTIQQHSPILAKRASFLSWFIWRLGS